MKFLVTLSLLALALSTQLRIEESYDETDSAAVEAINEFDSKLEEILGNVFFDMSSRLEDDLAIAKADLAKREIQAVVDEQTEETDEDDTEAVQEVLEQVEDFADWSETLQSDMSDALLESLAAAGEQLSLHFKENLKTFAEKLETKEAAKRALRGMLSRNK